MQIRSETLVEISSDETDLCTEVEKVTGGKRYFGIEQNILLYDFMTFQLFLIFLQSSRKSEWFSESIR